MFQVNSIIGSHVSYAATVYFAIHLQFVKTVIARETGMISVFMLGTSMAQQFLKYDIFLKELSDNILSIDRHLNIHKEGAQ